jgi:hypothetical protein
MAIQLHHAHTIPATEFAGLKFNSIVACASSALKRPEQVKISGPGS